MSQHSGLPQWSQPHPPNISEPQHRNPQALHMVSPPHLDSFENEETAFCAPTFAPSSGHKAEARIGAPDCFRIDICVMPFTRPDEISDCVSLSDKLGREDRTLVAEHGAVDSLLAAGVDEFSPNKERVGISCAKDNLLAGAGEEVSLAAVTVAVAGIMSFIEFQT